MYSFSLYWLLVFNSECCVVLVKAATRALRQAKAAGITELTIYTDSQFLISC